MKNTNTTSKKVKVLGTEQFVNTQTGEIEDFQVSRIEERDFNFTKIWLTQMLATLGLLGNKKTKVAYYIIDNLNKDNTFIGTYRQIAKATSASLPTVTTVMKTLLDANFLRRQLDGVYTVNPNIMFKGGRNARLNVLQTYDNTEQKPISDEEKIQNLQNSIAALQKQLKKLQARKESADIITLPQQEVAQ